MQPLLLRALIRYSGTFSHPYALRSWLQDGPHGLQSTQNDVASLVQNPNLTPVSAFDSAAFEACNKQLYLTNADFSNFVRISVITNGPNLAILA